jgi:hypothetical protein
VPLAERSEKATVEDQQHILFILKIGEVHSLTGEIRQGKIGGFFIQFNAIAHTYSSQNQDETKDNFNRRVDQVWRGENIT